MPMYGWGRFKTLISEVPGIEEARRGAQELRNYILNGRTLTAFVLGVAHESILHELRCRDSVFAFKTTCNNETVPNHT